MSNTIPKPDLKKALEAKHNPSKKALQFFETFFFLNESQGLPRDLKRNHSAALNKLERDPDLKDRYYLFHLLKTWNKWQTIEADDLVNHFYKNSKLIKEIWEAL